MLKNVLFYSLLTLINVTLIETSYAQTRWQKADYIKTSFIDIALGREYEKQQIRKLVRWQNTIKVHISSDSGDADLQKDLLSVQIKHLASITGHPIQFDVPLAQANISIIFTQYDQMRDKVKQYIGNPKNYEKALGEAICLGTFKHNRRGEIFKGVIIIPVDYARQNARFLDCIIEEITQLLGLPNDSDKVFPSIFNDHSIDAYLSPLDYILLKVLYSPRLKAGMSLTQVTDKLDSVIADLNMTGEIQDAASRVNRQSLKQYIGD
jgi:hypothetical protein